MGQFVLICTAYVYLITYILDGMTGSEVDGGANRECPMPSPSPIFSQLEKERKGKGEKERDIGKKVNNFPFFFFSFYRERENNSEGRDNKQNYTMFDV